MKRLKKSLQITGNLAYRAIVLIFILSQFAAALPPVLAAPASAPLHTTPSITQSSISLSRVQTSYVAGQTVVEFTLTNNLPATRMPDIPESATLTDTVDILATFAITDDVNTLRGVTLADTLAAGTTLLAASGDPEQSGNTLTWSLPDLPPRGTATISLTLQTPAQTSGFVNLDTGAQANAEQWGDPVTTTASPAVLIPAGIDATLTLPTADADARDADMLWQSAALGQDALAMFAYVQSLGYEAYKGSLRGTRGTLWGQAGNAPDKSSLLIAMLRAAGIPARYRHGTLDTADAQTLIASMFPASPGMAGSIPAGTPVSDPVNDPDLLALVSDHWWVEAYLPSGWTNLDPSFADAQPGDVFATPGADDRIPELPDNLRHKVTFKLEVEQYSTFPIGGSNLVSLYPIEVTFNTVELASRPLTFGHMVETDVQGGVYSNVTHTYTPYFTVEGTDDYTLGETYQDLLSTFPLATVFTTAVWLTVETQDADGHGESFTREIKDLIGQDVRLNGGALNLSPPPNNAALFGPGDAFVMWFLPNQALNNAFTNRYREALFARGLAYAVEMNPAMELFDNPNPSPEDFAQLSQVTLSYQLNQARFMAQTGLDFARSADLSTQLLEDGLRVRMIYSLPRIISLGAEFDTVESVVKYSLDLRSTRTETLVAPGQATAAGFTANWLKGVSESYQEGEALGEFTGIEPMTTARIFEEMTAQGIEPLWLTPATMSMLDVYPLPSEATAYAKAALMEGKNILIPSAPVLIDGEPTLGWWEIDPVTGETIGVGEDGLHISLVEWAAIEIGFGLPFLLNDVWDIRNSVKEIWDYVVCHVVPALGGTTTLSGDACTFENPFNLPWPFSCSFCGFNRPEGPDPTAWMDMPAHQCPTDNCGIERFVFQTARNSPIPLPAIGFAYGDKFVSQTRIGAALPVTDNGSSGAPTLELSTTPGSSALTPAGSATFDVTLSANFSGEVQVTAYAPEGWFIAFTDENTLTLTAPPDALAGDYSLTLVGQSDEFPDTFAVFEHPVTVSVENAVSLTITPENLLTVPMGDAAFEAVSNQTNDAEAEISDSAWVVEISNATASPTTFDVTVSGAPAGWVILDGARQTSSSVTLSAGERTRLGLYLSPPEVPAPGTAYTLNVNVSGGAFSDDATINWTMPGQPFNYFTLQPSTIYLGSGSSTDFSIEMTNVGNAEGTYPLFTVASPITASVTGLPSSVSLAVGETQTLNATVETSGVPLGTRFPIILGSPAPDSYTQYAILTTQIVSPITEPVFIASDHAANACTLGEPGLSAALESLALAMVHLEASCLNGDCNLSLRDQTVNAAYSVALYGGGISTGIVEDEALIAVADELASHTDNADIMTDLQNLSDAVVALDAEVCAWSESKPDLTWTPYYNAALISQPATYTLGLTNEGTLATTYNLTVTLPSSVVSGQYSVNPGETSSFEFPVSSPTLSLLDLSATATVADHSAISDSADAVLNVVDKFVQLTAVTPDPPFVETGVSSTDISIGVANNANILQPATAHVEILHATGGISHTADIPVTILIGSPRNYALDTVDTSGWETGVYTITVELRTPSGALIPDGTGYGYLGVGQAVGISHAVEPVIVAPGAVTVTTVITTEILTPAIISNTVFSGQYSVVSDDVVSQQSTNPQLPISNNQYLISAFPITRTEDTDPALTYAGVWTVVTSGGASARASHNDYTWADATGETATMSFSGTWLHLGFLTDSSSGQAEIFVDGVSQGVIDMFSRDTDQISFVYDGFANAAHTLQIFVLGTHHPNSTNNRVYLDYVDTWDGTLYADGWVEQDSPRVWHNNNWTTFTNANASGGTYMTDDGNNAGSAWFPFTGDSVTFVGLANSDGFRTGVYVDGVWQQNLWMYNSTAITRTLSLDGFGPGPHVLRISNYYAEPNVDAFVTPALEPGYVPPVETGVIRYEEDDPGMLYNGYSYRQRPNSWFRDTATAPYTSDIGDVHANVLNNTIQFTFEGRWVNLGFISGTSGGQAEVFIDGMSQGIIGTYQSPGGPIEFQYGNLITGTHTLSITILAQPDPPGVGTQIYFDYIDVWDGTPLSDDFVNVHKGTPTSRLHFNKSGVDATSVNALNGDFFTSGLPNSFAGVWYHFTGDSFSLFGFTRNNTTNINLYVDGQFIENVSFDYPYSEQPFAYHYTGFGDGPHTVRVQNVATMRLDGFASNPTSLATYRPVVEWYESDRTAGASIWGGLHVPTAVGDINGDGKPEIVVATSNMDNNGELFVLNGDGRDAGDGTPILWSHPYNIFNGFEDVGAPAIAELDGQPGAEIIHATANGMYVYHNDGSLYWSNPSYVSFAFFSSPAVGNLDLDPEPEIAINLSNKLVVFEQDGTIAWEQLFPATVSSPVLADLNGDGLLDILVYASGQTTLFAYNYNYGSPVILWSQTLPSALSVYGTPAVADIDGLQPGGDPGPEVAVSTYGNISVLNGENGSFVWTIPLDPGDSSGVSIADVDGDGEVEMIAGIKYNGGMIYAVNADGSILWGVPALDNSPVNPSLFDLNGDGVYEITFNGAGQGLTIYNGPDGATLFNEPSLAVRSQTGSDFPLFADVDNDGFGELVVPAQNGLRVFGWDHVWGASRPLWNELTYHITNINDDFSIPFSEPNSWDVHNTYRTQTILVSPMPSYAIALTHTVGLDNVTVLTNTFNIPPTTSNAPAYGWDYSVTWENTVVTQTFTSLLTNLQPGESRMVAQSTTADYVAPGGTNHLELHPLFVSAAHIVTLEPMTQTVGAGGVAVFDVVFTNPTGVNALFMPTVSGLPAAWVQLMGGVPVPAGGTVAAPLTISVPFDADLASLPFQVNVTTDLGWADQASGVLNVTNLLELSITPANQTVTTGEVATYTLSLTNAGTVARTYTLSGSGLAALTLPEEVTVPANSTASVAFSAQAVSEGANPFTLTAMEENGTASGQATAMVTGEGFQQVEVTILPASAPTGPGVLTPFDVRITNLGTVPDTYDLTTAIPAEWEASLTLFGQPVEFVEVAPGPANALTLQLLLTPASDAFTGDYDFSVTAQSLVSDTGVGVAQVGTLGVSVALSGPAQISGSGVWDVTVTNNGVVADTYDLTAFGPFAQFGQFSAPSVSLVPGASQTVQLTVSGIGWLATDYLLGVHAQSQTQSYIQDEAALTVSILPAEGVEVDWQPNEQTVNGTTHASFILVVTNTGNVQAVFDLSTSVPAGVTVQIPSEITVPAFGSAVLIVEVTAPGNGTYSLTVFATGLDSQASDIATLIVEGVEADTKLYLPIIYHNSTN